VKTQNTKFTFNNFFFSENCARYEIMWKNMAHPDRPQKTMWHTQTGRRRQCGTPRQAAEDNI